MARFHLAQVNIARMKFPFESPEMHGFVSRLDEINALADRAEGFVWRMVSVSDQEGYLRPYEDDRILVNFSVWESVEALKDYAYRTAHAELLRDRRQWFEETESAVLALWWVPAGHIPSVDEAKKRLAHLQEHGPSQFAFNFRTIQPPDEEAIAALDWSAFRPCPAG